MLDLIPHEVLPGELQEFRTSVRRFVDKELIPLEHELRDDGLLDPELAAQVRDKARTAGFWMMEVPEDLGGQGLSLLALAVFWEEIGRTTTASSARDHGLFGPIVGPMLLGLNEDQRKKYLYPVLEGKKNSCFAQTEPDAGSDPSAMRTRAVRTDTGYRITGVKTFITRAAAADFALVMALTEPGTGDPRNRISCFIVDMDAPGVTLATSERTLMGDTPCEIVFDNVEIPHENLVGEEGRGFVLAQRYINYGRVRQGAHACGAAVRCLELTARHVNQRKTFGDALASRQGVQWMLADAFTELYAARMLTYDAARKTDAGLGGRMETFMVKTFAVEMGFRVADLCMQLHGGLGLTLDTPIERTWRDLRSYRITEEPTEVLKTSLARQIIKHFV